MPRFNIMSPGYPFVKINQLIIQGKYINKIIFYKSKHTNLHKYNLKCYLIFECQYYICFFFNNI